MAKVADAAKTLADSLAGFSEGDTISVALVQTNGVQQTWIADADYVLIGVMLLSSGASDMVLSLDGYLPGGTGLFQNANKTKVGNILAACKSLSGNLSCPPQRTRIAKGATVYLNNQSVNLGCALLTLERSTPTL